MYDALVKDENVREEQAKQVNPKMSIMASYGDDTKKDDGTMMDQETIFSATD